MAQLPDGAPAPRDGSLPVEALDSTRPLSLYVHVPFCRLRCGYCDFNTYVPGEKGATSPSVYLRAASSELDLAARILGPRSVGTVFFGGGTPTMLPADDLLGVLSAIARRFDLLPDAEITTEANPETLTPAYLERLRHGGFTRLSLGVQSMRSHVLAVLEREHSPRRGIEAANWAKQAGFEHISLDLIYGTPGESMDDWRASLDAVAATPTDHVSAYSLIVEEGTRLAGRVRRGQVPMPDDDDLADKYLVTEAVLSGLGMVNYEISNWAKPGGACQHNLVYWRGGDWWGIGPGAHSHIGGVRFWNRKHPRSYAAALAAGDSPALGREVLDARTRHVEKLLLGLRLAEGIEVSELTPTQRSRISSLPPGMAVVAGQRLRLSPAGRLLADAIIRDLLD